MHLDRLPDKVTRVVAGTTTLLLMPNSSWTTALMPNRRTRLSAMRRWAPRCFLQQTKTSAVYSNRMIWWWPIRK